MSCFNERRWAAKWTAASTKWAVAPIPMPRSSPLLSPGCQTALAHPHGDPCRRAGARGTHPGLDAWRRAALRACREQAQPAWRAGDHSGGRYRRCTGPRRTVKVLVCLVTWRPHPEQISSARRSYEDWWQAAGWISRRRDDERVRDCGGDASVKAIAETLD